MKLPNWLKCLFSNTKTFDLSGEKCEICGGSDIAYLFLYNTTTGVQIGEKNKFWIACDTCAPGIEKRLRGQFACIFKSFPIDENGNTAFEPRFWEPN